MVDPISKPRTRQPSGERPKLTDSVIASVIKNYATTGQRTELIDPACEGLRLRPKKGGKSAVWSLLVRDLTGDNRRFVLGEYPTIGIAKARELAGDMRHQVRREGLDPNRIKQEKREAAQQAAEPLDAKFTLKGILDSYETMIGTGQTNWPEAKGKIKLVFSRFLEIDARKLTSEEVQIAADEYKSPGSASSAVRYLRPIIKWAAKRGYAAREISLIEEPRKAQKRGRYLSEAELKLLLPVLKTYPGKKRRSIQAQAMLFMLLTATRRQETAEATWGEISDGIWTIPVSRIKNTKSGDSEREPHIILLSRQAQALLASIKPARVKPDTFVFPSRFGKPLSGWDRVTKAIQKKAGVYGWHRHDLRRTAATHMGKLGIPPHVIEAALNHKEIHSELAGTYNLARYTEEVGRAFQALADWLDKIVAQDAV